ncbi:MAG: caspase family protein [Bacteroidota bacterium]
MHLSALPLLLAFVLAAPAWAPNTSAEPPGTRRALLVGINTYEPADGSRSLSSRTWFDLEGTINDVSLMQEVLIERGFAPRNVRTLANRDATRKGILDAIEALIARAEPGDHLVFYYAGHGSQVTNTATDEADGKDESIVPSDAALGAPDIRDKELRRLWNRALDAVGPTGSLAVIQDNCHSGSGSRGPVLGAARKLEADSTQTVDDGEVLDDPSERGALLISAAQDDEPSREIIQYGITNGGFTWALAQALRSTPVGASARTVFDRASALVQSTGLTQVPVLEGPGDQALFGEALSGFSAEGISVGGIDGDAITLRGGVLQGLGVGATLTRFLTTDETGQARSDSTVQLTVIEEDGVARSIATVTRGDALTVRAGDLFRITRWVPPPARPLRVWLPAPVADVAEVLANASASPCIPACVTDPIRTHAEGALLHTDTGWMAYADGQPIDAAQAPKGALFQSLPAPRAFHDTLTTRLADLGGVEVVTDPREADYWLAGQLVDGAPRYRWLLTQATAGDTLSALPLETSSVGSGHRSANELASLTHRLARVNGWLALNAPPEDAFPVRILGLRQPDGSLLGPDRVLSNAMPPTSLDCGRRCLQVTIGVDQTEADDFVDAYGFARRLAYLFVILPDGSSSLLWGRRGVENAVILPDDDALQPGTGPEGEAALLAEVGPRFGMRTPPYGRHTFVLLTTDTPIPQAELVFNTEPILGERRAGANPLADLLATSGTVRGGFEEALPASWSIHRYTIDIVPE